MNKLLLIICFLLPTLSLAETVVVLPERFNNKKVISVNSKEFNELVEKNKNLEEQLKKEKKDWELYSIDLDRKLQETHEINNQMIREIEKLREVGLKTEKLLVQKDLVIWRRNATIACLILLIGIYCYLKFVLHIPFL
jgi:Rad3-related DNA helicase